MIIGSDSMDDTVSLQTYGLSPTTPDYLDGLLLSQLPPKLRRASAIESAADSRLASVLSASSYPVPAPLDIQRSDPRLSVGAVPAFGGILVGEETSEDEGPDISPEEMAFIPESDETQPAPKRRRTVKAAAAKSTAKKPGRPLIPKDDDLKAGNPQERRRIQLRRAQRAYRSRKEATISGLQDRNAQLQLALEKMSAAVVSFSGIVMQSNALNGNPKLAIQLRDMTQTCLQLAKETSEGEGDGDDGSGKGNDQASSNNVEETLYAMTVASKDCSSIPMEISLTTTGFTDTMHNIAMDRRINSFYPLQAPQGSSVEYSTFSKRLRVACLLQSYAALGDPSISSKRLRRPFRLLWTLMDRERMTTFFEAALNAAVVEKRIEDYQEIPFFALGGAGSHYSRPSALTDTFPYSRGRLQLESDTVSQLPVDVQQEFDGTWFDMQDLEGYLHENKVQLFITRPNVSDLTSPASMYVNVARFIATLTKRAVCLGRSPGFQFKEVQKALRSAMWT